MLGEDKLSKIDKEIDQLKSRIKGLEDLKVEETVFDRFTLLTLYELSNKGYIDVLHGAIKTGKESNVFLAHDSVGKPIAVKIHRMVTSDFRAMLKYIEGDRRFKKTKRNRRNIILTWVLKEYKNLRTAYEAGVHVPMPIYQKNNVLVMEYIGDDEGAALTLKKADYRGEKLFRDVFKDVKKLYKAGLVHGDLSEYNILVWNDSPVIIDLSQSVPLSHPLADELLKRDLHNLARFFGKKFDKLYNQIVGLGEGPEI